MPATGGMASQHLRTFEIKVSWQETDNFHLTVIYSGEMVEMRRRRGWGHYRREVARLPGG